MAAPLFSNTCTKRQLRLNSSTCAIHSSITARISATDKPASVRSWRGEKHSTRQAPRCALAAKSRAETSVARASARKCAGDALGDSGRKTGKSLGKAYVEV